MDVPAKESYTMAIVGSDERVAMARLPLVCSSGAGTVGPSVTTALWSAFSASVPLVDSALLKFESDLSLYDMFCNAKPPEEIERTLERTVIKRTSS